MSQVDEMDERRYLGKLSQEIVEKFSGVEQFQLKDIVEFIVNKERSIFNLGIICLHDQVNKTFTLGGFFPAGGFPGVESEIREILDKRKSDLDADAPPGPGCGLFYFVARNFSKKENEKLNYLAINHLEEFKKEDKYLAQFDINIEVLGQQIKSQYIFPVYCANKQQGNEEREKILHAVIVLASFSDRNNIRKQDLKLLSDLISFIISVEARKIANRAIHTFINTLSDVGKVSYSKNEYRKIIQSLERLYVEKEEKDTLKQCLLKHASIWTLNDIDKDNMFLVKERNFNYKKKEGKMDLTDIITNRKVSNCSNNSVTHYFYDFIIEKKKKIDDSKKNRQSLPFQDLVATKKFMDISNQFYDRNQFQKLSGIEDNDIVVLFPIFPHLGQEKDDRKDSERKEFIGLMVLYFAQNTCAYYYKTDLLELIAHKIYENMQIVISKTGRKIQHAIFEKISDLLKDEQKFCQAAAKVIGEKMDFEQCLIYLFNNDQTSLRLMTEGDQTRFPVEINIDQEASYRCLLDIVKGWRRSNLNYFQELQAHPKTETPFLWYNPAAIAPDAHIAADAIYSAMMIPIQVPKNNARGVLICLNNKRNIDSEDTSDRSFFSLKDLDIASIGVESIAIYIEISQLATSQRQLLRKFAHEIPGQMNYIRQVNRQIKEEVESIIERLRKKLDPNSLMMVISEHQRRLLFNRIGHQSQAARRVLLFAEYSRLEKLDSKNIDSERQPLNLETFLASTIDGFRLSAEKQGVFVQFEIEHDLGRQKKSYLDVHPLFELAVWNLINNAIQYAYFGTVIHITCEFGLNFNRIHVKNIGIGIPTEMKEKMFQEGIRTEAAKKKFFMGTGQGLLLAQKVVKAHDGEILIENRNNICTRNVFGLYELKRVMDGLLTDADRERFINQKSPERKKYADFKSRLEFTPQETDILSKYSKYLPSRSDRADEYIVRDYLRELFDGNENLDTIFEREIDVPVSYVNFCIQLPSINIRNF